MTKTTLSMRKTPLGMTNRGRERREERIGLMSRKLESRAILSDARDLLKAPDDRKNG
jgi:hypothetical protein